MRVTTSMLFDAGKRAMTDRQADLFRTQEQLSTGRRVLSPSDDPIAAAQALGIGQAKDLTTQYAANVGSARDALAQSESAVSDLQSTYDGIRERLLEAGNASYSDAERRSIALDLRSRLAQLVEIGNRRDGNGRALFGGYAEDAVPFVDNGTRVTYAGDQGTRALRVAASREIPVGTNGAALFLGIPVGNGTFETAAGAANAGDASISAGSVVDPALVTGRDYDIVFTVIGASTTYQIIDSTLGVVISSGNPYTSGASLTVGGQQVKVSGAPANGDRFTIAPASRQDVFKTVRDAIDLLETPTTTPAARGRFATGLERALTSLDQASERALAVRTRFGASQRELDSLEATHSGLSLEYDRQVSKLQDLDYAAAVSDFAREQQALDAAQKAFKGTTQLSLFALL
jgi:flagellar hook-associated protein 3 FlgL